LSTGPGHAAPTASTAPPRSRTSVLVEDGILCGTLGAFVVAVFFLMIDALRGQVLYTPSLLGSVLFLGKTVETSTSVDMSMVFAFTGLHGLLFLIAGTAVAWMVSEFEENPQFGMVLLLIFLLVQAILFGFEVTLVPNLVGALGAWAVGSANILAALAMFAYLLRRHPGAMSRLRQGWNE
jgi:hypothetical protein